MRHAEWGQLTPQVCPLARDAGGAVMRIYTTGAQAETLVKHKADDSPLTRADTASHHCIVVGLASLTPGIKVVSEEDAGSLKHRTASGSFWLVDPLASKSHLNEETSAFIGQLGDVALVQAGSSLKFCRIAQGLADVYPRLAPTCEWDTAAAQAVVEGAGGYVYDPAGERLCYGKPEILNPSFIAASLPFSALPAIP